MKDQVCHLFRPGKNYNLAQWAIEYVETALGMKVGPAMVALTDLLCSESPPRIQIAAALGLPSLCRQLREFVTTSQVDHEVSLDLPRPLYYALLGPHALRPQKGMTGREAFDLCVDAITAVCN